MEFDNDKPIRRTPASEFFLWSCILLFSPLLMGICIFPQQFLIWLALLVVNVITFPAYLAFAKLLVPRILFTEKRRHFFILTVGFVILTVAINFSLYHFITAVNIVQPHAYFNLSSATFIREIILVAINSCIALTIGYINKDADSNEELNELRRDNISYRLKYLRSQLNPHFLFNTLNSIYSLSLQRSDRTSDVVVKLADIMRYLVYDCQQDRIPLKKEIEFIRNYIDIEKIRYNADIKFDVKGEIEGRLIEPYLFLPFIENGFKHAFSNSHIHPFIYIGLQITDSELTLTVLNNTNIDLETQAKRISGKSIQNSKGLLELLYPQAYELDIIQTDKEDKRESKVRMKNAQDRLKNLYPDAHDLDIILNNNTFTVSLNLKLKAA